MEIHDKVANFSLYNQDEQRIQLKDFAGKPVVLFFYPKADTPGCTIEACGFRDTFTKLQKAGAVVLGISRDTPKAQKKFQEKEHLPFVLLSDREKKVTSAFGVPLIMNSLATRQAYLFKDGKLVWMDAHASTDKQARDVLNVLAQ